MHPGDIDIDDAGASDIDDEASPLDDLVQLPKRPSGAKQRSDKRAADRLAAERERERNGTDDTTRDLIRRLGDPPLDPTMNAAWANNAAAVMASITIRDETIPRELRFKQVAELLDRVGATTVKAHQAKRIAELQNKAGVKTEPKPDGTRVVPIDRGGTLRAGSRIQRRSALPGSLPDLSPEGDGGNPANGRGDVG